MLLHMRVLEMWTDPATVASLFNQYFSRIAVDLTKGFQPQNSTSDVP